MTETQELTPAQAASQASWRCVQSGDREGWLALMSDDVVVEDPIGEAVTNPDGTGVRGKEALAAFYDANIGPNELTVTCEEAFPSSSPTEIAYILVLRTKFPNGFTATVRGVFTYKVDDAGLITNLRGYWNMAAMKFSEEGAN
ncbi:nuclear transport factor 2 [Mycolicibacterium mageritense DSM 44476 = CIP 104973]|uniref:Steroid Delta-isomerase n=1 Tax=Mycolicibacterium mageritense TaxID=53462 RepID=A0ABM7HUM4_MYCME|nr:nuclear transport factor 2 family protein [Mycolicibacterium mageritense]OKH78241.1 steroid delta-isomerase [Mycobacterium sp. SWH-M3]MCC9181844.1 nuclear transport factor 2 family protein [Mycolicibacterium mageritense]CDO21204.1 nuclear transport factor 2 [Mycolicibacterium mageritense DSM 44476 = CIP 104973]BBX34274.1 steroid Delta-isomerase [Mycolicibacterium mageritense]GJJ17948.1 steroid Delta-isomerase [Mycolicibacterium mageritense]